MTRVALYCPHCSHRTRASIGAVCPMGHGALRASAVEPSHRKRPSSPSDRPPVGAEPGSLFDRLEER